MKSQALTTEGCDTKLGHGALAPGGLVDIDVAHIAEFPGLYVQVAIGQTGSCLHLHESHRLARNERGQDAKATGGAYHFVELKLHEVIYFVSRSICPDQRPVKRSGHNELTLNFMT